jgi:integrase
MTAAPQRLCCPECGSSKIWKDGIRYTTNNGAIQRYLCRACGYRFSQPSIKVNVSNQFRGFKSSSHLTKTAVSKRNFSTEKVLNDSSFPFCKNVGSHSVTNIGKHLNSFCSYNSKHRVCVSNKEAKNLEPQTELKTVAGEKKRKIDAATAKGLLLQYELWLAKEGYGEKSRYIDCIRMLINSGADVLNPEHVKEIIGKKKWKDGTKMQACYAYDAMTRMLKLSWAMPTYKQEENLPFIPEPKEIDSLISAARSRKLATYLQTLRETMADPTEALRLKWINLNLKENSIVINRPVKNHNPRQIPITNQLVSMLNMLPKKSELVFDTSYTKIAERFRNMRKKVASNLQNPRILSITLRTFRHFGATMLYAQTRDILLVKKLLGHKKIENTLKYTQLINFKDNEYETATATDIEEAKQLISSGFEYVTDMNSIKLFRKPKRFGS